ncbi:MAG: NUDIX hydrolase [Pseudomonadota bacterium]
MSASKDFTGAKLALFIGAHLAVIRRDDKPGLPYRGHLDLPGGAREDTETPEACVLRELREELGLTLHPPDLRTPRFYTYPNRAWFFSAHLPSARAKDIVFGDEGQGWSLMDPWAFVSAGDGVPHVRDRVRAILHALPANQVEW